MHVHSVRAEPLPGGYRLRADHAVQRFDAGRPGAGPVGLAHPRNRPAADGSAAPFRPLRGLVLDLRGNPGGVLESAVGVADEFLDRA